jgi:hypothetical protein
MKGDRSAARARLWLGCLALLAGVGTAQAQSTYYRCPGPQGGSTLSDRPCNAQGRATISAYGPVPERRSTPSYGGYGNYTPQLQRAPEYQAYLSAHCAQLNDALRTAPNRGVRGPALNDLYDTYRRECAEDESAAYQHLYRERMAQREQRQAQAQATQAQREQQRNQREQCDEMQRILHARRQQLASLHEGQKADLQRFQDSYAQRCTGG